MKILRNILLTLVVLIGMFFYVVGVFPPSEGTAAIASFMKMPALCAIVPERGWDTMPRESCYYDVAYRLSNDAFQDNDELPVKETHATDACDSIADASTCYATVAANVHYLAICNRAEVPESCYDRTLRILYGKLSASGIPTTATTIRSLSCDDITQNDIALTCTAFSGSSDAASDCENIDNETYRMFCHNVMSNRVSTIEGCAAMTDTRAQDSCIFRFAASLNRIDLCDELNDPTLMHPCRTNVISEHPEG